MKQIPDFPDYYITECGLVYSGKKTSELQVKGSSLDGRGYLKVILYKDGKGYTRRIHKLVASVFLGDSQLWVLHNDGNKLHNCVDNLRYGTNSENQIDSSIHGTHGNRKLTDTDVRAIRKEIGTFREIGRKYGVGHTTISRIQRFETFTHVE